MGYEYGMEICNDVLKYLAENRFDEGLSEMEIMEPGDVSHQHYADISELLRRYYEYEDLREVAEKGYNRPVISLQESLRNLCNSILKFNKGQILQQYTDAGLGTSEAP